MGITPEILNRLQLNPPCIRNICILAHVDHGKTTLSDSLLATNGIISQRMAGKVRYLDSRPDEQLRGITMESSAISLYFRLMRKKLSKDSNNGTSESEAEEKPVVEEHLINLIDSPGHIDFSSEVSIASRLCDGALVLIDVVEGIQSQTVTVLRQAWNDKLKPVLVLNKIDRLMGELKMSPDEAYTHLKKIVEQANAVIGSFFAGQRMIDDELYRESLEKNPETQEYIEKDDSHLYFQPEKNNVIFASAIDNWGFTIQQFSAFYEKKLGYKKENLQKVLWGDFYLDPKTKKVINYKGLKGRTLKPLFVSLILDNIWKIYANTVTLRDQEVLNKIITTLNIKILPRDLRSKDSKALLRQIMSQWLPISSSILITVVEQLLPPVEAQKIRIPAILDAVPNSELIDPKLQDAMLLCDMNGPVSCYVSKMISVPDDELPKNSKLALSADEKAELGRAAREKAMKVAEQARQFSEEKKLSDDVNDLKIVDNNTNIVSIDNSIANDFGDFGDFEEDFETLQDDAIEVPKESLIGFARVYSGTLKVGQELNVLGPKYDPKNPTEHITTIVIEDLYLLMGRELLAIDQVPAGNIVGIGGLAGKILKNGSLIDQSVVGVNLAGISFASPPIVKVALEPVNPIYLDKLEHGLKLLVESDPCAESYITENGENILMTSGELHLERCLKDLKERFAGVDIQASEPAIPYRETIVYSSEMNPVKNPELGRGNNLIKVGEWEISVGVKPLPKPITDYLINNSALIHAVINLRKKDKADTLKKELASIFDIELEDLKLKEFYSAKIVDQLVAFGPRRTGPNILVDKSGKLSKVFQDVKNTNRLAFEDTLLNGFQLAITEGPLAAEPVQGIAVFVESINTINTSEQQFTENAGEADVNVSNFSGRLLKQTKDAIQAGFLDWSPRIMLAMYSCDIQATAEVLGKVYGVVQKRRGRIISEEMKEGTLLFSIHALIPVTEAFGFSEEFRKKTSGAAIPQLVFHGYEIIDEDPFWVPTTEEELEQLGTFAERENVARRYMNNIRKSKGLFVEEKAVQNAEKQRTLRKD